MWFERIVLQPTFDSSCQRSTIEIDKHLIPLRLHAGRVRTNDVSEPFWGGTAWRVWLGLLSLWGVEEVVGRLRRRDGCRKRRDAGCICPLVLRCQLGVTISPKFTEAKLVLLRLLRNGFSCPLPKHDECDSLPNPEYVFVRCFFAGLSF